MKFDSFDGRKDGQRNAVYFVAVFKISVMQRTFLAHISLEKHKLTNDSKVISLELYLKEYTKLNLLKQSCLDKPIMPFFLWQICGQQTFYLQYYGRLYYDRKPRTWTSMNLLEGWVSFEFILTPLLDVLLQCLCNFCMCLKKERKTSNITKCLQDIWNSHTKHTLDTCTPVFLTGPGKLWTLLASAPFV